MKFSLTSHNCRLDADEFKCSINDLGRFPGKRYNITYEKDIIIPEKIKYLDYTFATKNINDLINLIKKGYNTYLNYPVSDWESFNLLKQMKVSDIWIDGPLGFQVDRLKLGKENINIRVCPNFSLNVSLNNLTENVNSFFIRPEDLKEYEECIDYIEFYHTDKAKEEACFNIYKNGSYSGSLDLLIPTSRLEINNQFINSSFGKNRKNCGQLCKIPGHKCNICMNQMQVIKQLKGLME